MTLYNHLKRAPEPQSSKPIFPGAQEKASAKGGKDILLHPQLQVTTQLDRFMDIWLSAHVLPSPYCTVHPQKAHQSENGSKVFTSSGLMCWIRDLMGFSYLFGILGNVKVTEWPSRVPG